MLRVESGLFFANADDVHDRPRARAETAAAVVLDAETVPESTSPRRRCWSSSAATSTATAIALFARDIGQVRDVLRHRGAVAAAVFPSVDAALEEA